MKKLNDASPEEWDAACKEAADAPKYVYHYSATYYSDSGSADECMYGIHTLQAPIDSWGKVMALEQHIINSVLSEDATSESRIIINSLTLISSPKVVEG